MTAESPTDLESSDILALPGRQTLDMGTVRALSRRDDVRGLVRFAGHLACMACTGMLVWLALGYGWLLAIPAMMLHGFTIVTMFAPMHECVHKTAFKSPRLNDIAGWIAGALCFYNFTYYRRYHTWHHRYTQDHQRDPELSTPKPRNVFDYVLHVSGLPFWFSKPMELLGLAAGRTEQYPFIPTEQRRPIVRSAQMQLGLYAALAIMSIVLRSTAVLYYWFLPALLAQPLLRAILIVEHTGCTMDDNGLTNTRTTLASWPVRFLMWNMPYHAEHHLYPSIPFFCLPDAHRHLRQRFSHVSPSYPTANAEVVRTLGNDPMNS
ncbi:MAG TPA: fatty acid desaturase [Pirellulales bacterium]|jgi:fatty acid desaturase|nr:fatty acid desaturase [Pirellulales bacterium]